MVFGFNLAMVFIVAPLTILLVAWPVTGKKVLGKILGFIWLGAIGFTMSCSSISKSVYNTKAGNLKIRFYTADSPSYRKGESRFYARVDSNAVRITYTYHSGNIYKSYRGTPNILYTVTPELEPMVGLSYMDSIVLAKGEYIMDSLGLTDFKRARGATGFNIEIAGH